MKPTSNKFVCCDLQATGLMVRWHIASYGGGDVGKEN